jgi:hypothetical protein
LEIVLSLMLGFGLAAAVGFRIFVPFFIVSLAAHTGHLQLAEGFAWLGSFPALVMFGAATFLEIAAYAIPWLDNLLDVVAGPLAVICGAVLMASTVFDLDPFIAWPLAIIAGGGTAGLIKGANAGLRLTSSATTAGLGNPAVTVVETSGSAVMAGLAIFLPVLAFLLVVWLVVFLARKLVRSGGRSARKGL